MVVMLHHPLEAAMVRRPPLERDHFLEAVAIHPRGCGRYPLSPWPSSLVTVTTIVLKAIAATVLEAVAVLCPGHGRYLYDRGCRCLVAVASVS